MLWIIGPAAKDRLFNQQEYAEKWTDEVKLIM
jgi:hypothetical protein